jgi:hypothetical protein
MNQNRKGTVGHARRSMRLGERDPRNRRETQERASDNTLARSGNLRLDQLGRMEVDVEALADELERRGFTKGGSGG